MVLAGYRAGVTRWEEYKLANTVLVVKAGIRHVFVLHGGTDIFVSRIGLAPYLRKDFQSGVTMVTDQCVHNTCI